MNLINDAWVPTDIGIVTAEDALRGASEICWHRADWNVNTYIFLIALLQTAVVRDPGLCEDNDDWEELLQGRPDQFANWFSPMESAFHLYGDSPFMQVKTRSQAPVAESAVLLEAPKDNAIKKNSDLFIFRENLPSRLSDSERAVALFTMNSSGWSMGGGFLKNSRGGNAMSVLLVPEERKSVWQLVWQNVLSAETWEVYFSHIEFNLERVFPWLDDQYAGEYEGKVEVTPQGLHPLHVFWQMPSRVRWNEDGDGIFRDKGGLSYSAGGWRHPFTAYRTQKDGTTRIVPLPKGGMGYHYWSPFLLGAEADQPPINIFEHNLHRRTRAQLWITGWQIANAEALNFVSVKTPIVTSSEPDFKDHVARLLEIASSNQKYLYSSLTVAGLKGTNSYDLYTRTENDWYRTLASQLEPDDFDKWEAVLRKESLAIYNEYSANLEPMVYAKGLSRLRF